MPDWEQEVKERFRVLYEKETGSFRICDLWDPTVKSLPLDATIPNDSPAIKTLSSAEVNALLGKLNELGWLDQFKKFAGNVEMKELSQRGKEIKQVAIENVTKVVELAADNGVSREAIAAIEKIANEINRSQDSLLVIKDKEIKGSPEKEKVPEMKIEDFVKSDEVKRGPGRPKKAE